MSEVIKTSIDLSVIETSPEIELQTIDHIEVLPRLTLIA